MDDIEQLVVQLKAAVLRCDEASAERTQAIAARNELMRRVAANSSGPWRPITLIGHATRLSAESVRRILDAPADDATAPVGAES